MNRPKCLPPTSLRDVAALRSLDSQVLDALEACSVPYRLQHKEYLFCQGELAHSIYLIRQGGIRLIEHTADGQDVNIKVYGEGDIVGLLAISGEFPMQASGEAVGDTLVMGFPGQTMRHLMEIHASLALLVVDMLIHHVHGAHERLRHMMAERVDRRLARALLHYCEKFGQPINAEISAGISIEVPLTQQEMAQFTAATPETINRILKSWQERGWIRVSRQHIDVLNCVMLREMAEDTAYSMAAS